MPPVPPGPTHAACLAPSAGPLVGHSASNVLRFHCFPTQQRTPRCQAAGLAVTPIAPQGKALCGTWHLAFDIRPTGTNVSPVSRVEAGGFDCLPSRHQHARNTNTVGIDREPPDRPP